MTTVGVLESSAGIDVEGFWANDAFISLDIDLFQLLARSLCNRRRVQSLMFGRQSANTCATPCFWYQCDKPISGNNGSRGRRVTNSLGAFTEGLAELASEPRRNYTLRIAGDGSMRRRLFEKMLQNRGTKYSNQARLSPLERGPGGTPKARLNRATHGMALRPPSVFIGPETTTIALSYRLSVGIPYCRRRLHWRSLLQRC
jgi:hypothetical protein